MKQNMQLSDVLKVVWNNRWKIVLFTIISAVIGIALTYILPKKYESNAYFIVRLPAYSMRSSTFSNDQYGEVIYDYFASEREIDIVDGIVNSSYFASGIANEINSDPSAYSLSGPISHKQLKNSFKFKRNAQRLHNLRIMASNPEFSEKLSKLIIQKLTQSFNNYFQDSYVQKISLLKGQLQASKDQLTQLDTAIEALRKEYNLTTELAPQRGQALIAAGSQTVKEGTESLYNLILSKDELIQNITLIERGILQYETLSQDDHLDMIYIVSPAYIPVDSTFPNLRNMVLIGALLGFFISTLGIIITYIPRK
ncbi:MAG TPA: Wzz/FepE/Etk N-terminal domain-containing protein [Chitinophagaceae bacterium]|nr:Wzz/FepE/Etk N-terminal domain-containing protein [Chitinophagaceae bacterium]